MVIQPGFPWLSPTGTCGIHLEQSLPGTDEPNRLTAVARDEQGQIIGTLYFGVANEKVDPEVEVSVYVAPEHRRQGIASSLYEYVQEQGYDINAVSGQQCMTRDGAAFVRARTQGPSVSASRASILR